MVKNLSNQNIVCILIFLTLVSAIWGNMLFDRFVVFAILAACALLGFREKKFVNPYYLFIICPFSLLIFINFGNTYMMDLDHRTWLLGEMNMTAFLFALVYTPSFRDKNNCLGFNKSNIKVQIIFFFILALLAVVLPQLHSILWICAYPALAGVFQSKNKLMYFIALVYFVPIIVGGAASKTTMMAIALAFMFCYEKYYAVTPKQRKRMIYIAVVGVIFMFFSFSFTNSHRGVYNADEYMAYYTHQGIDWNYDNSLFLPYMYISSAWTNVQYIIDTQDVRTYGLWMLKPFLCYFNLDEVFNLKYELVPYSSFNTFTFICCGFQDFGYFFSIISPLFLGFFVKKVYTRFLISKSALDVACWILVGMATLEMFFTNHFYTMSYPFTVVIITEVYKRIFRKSLVVELEEDEY